jgi:hypothetical protein
MLSAIPPGAPGHPLQRPSALTSNSSTLRHMTHRSQREGARIDAIGRVDLVTRTHSSPSSAHVLLHDFIRAETLDQPFELGVLLLKLRQSLYFDRTHSRMLLLLHGTRFLRADTALFGPINLQSGRAQAVYAMPLKIPFPCPKFFDRQRVVLTSFFNTEPAALECFKQGSFTADSPSPDGRLR